MKKILIALVLMAGCVGSPTPRNPLDRPVPTTEAWWRASTIGVADKDNPWNALIPTPPPVKDWTDPWSDFTPPPLFPEGFVPARTTPEEDATGRLELHKQIEELKNKVKVLQELLKPKVEKSLFDRLKDLRKREKSYFDRSI